MHLVDTIFALFAPIALNIIGRLQTVSRNKQIEKETLGYPSHL